jgi:hypothetical protein
MHLDYQSSRNNLHSKVNFAGSRRGVSVSLTDNDNDIDTDNEMMVLLATKR